MATLGIRLSLAAHILQAGALTRPRHTNIVDFSAGYLAGGRAGDDR
jgi:hypothetical protein